MPIKEQVMADIKNAMKAGNQAALTVLRGVNSSLKNAEIAKQVKAGASATLTEDEALAVLLTEAKKRKDSIKAFTDAGRPELAENEQRELEVLQAYLPKQLSPAEVEEAVARIMAASGLTEFGPLMKAVMAELKGKADGALITEILKKKLG